MRPPTPIEALHSDCTNECCMLPGCSNQLLFDKHERVDSRQLWLEQGKNLGHTRSSSSSTTEAEIHSSGVKLLNFVQRENMGFITFHTQKLFLIMYPLEVSCHRYNVRKNHEESGKRPKDYVSLRDFTVFVILMWIS